MVPCGDRTTVWARREAARQERADTVGGRAPTRGRPKAGLSTAAAVMTASRPADTNQTLVVPVRPADQLLPGTFEHALNLIVDERIDLEELGKQWFCGDATGAPAYNPACLLKIVLLGYSRGLYFSRRTARAYADNVLFMAISGDCRPHFTTIAWFVRSFQEEVLSIFCTILLICAELDLVGESCSPWTDARSPPTPPKSGAARSKNWRARGRRSVDG